MKFATIAIACFSCLGTSIATKRSSAPTPVERVVILLKDLKSKIEEDGKTEQQVYDKYACWCETTSARKASAIETAQDDLRSLGQSILKLKGQVSVLTAEMEQLSKDMEANKEEQAMATSIRQRENAAFVAESTEMKEALAAMQQAIKILVEGTTLVQQGNADAAAARGVAAIRTVVEALPSNVALKPAHTAFLSEFMSAKNTNKYAPQSATVQGILKDMYETFASDLESNTLTEANANQVFEQLIATKTAELQLMESSYATKAGEKADAEALLADTTQNYDDTEKQKHADIEFFDATKASCEAKSAEWKIRSDMRREELRGITEALTILTGDVARQLFHNAIDQNANVTNMTMPGGGGGGKLLLLRSPSLLQVASDDASTAAAQGAYDALKAKATEAHSLRLAMLAVQVREAKVGHFDAVIAAIDSMITQLEDEDAADIAKRDQCIDEYKNIDSKVANITWLIEKNVAKIDKLQGLIDKAEAEKAQTIEDIATVEAEMAALTAQRKSENAEFKNAKAMDQAAIELLIKAREKLGAYYANHSIDMGPIQGDVKGLALAQQGPVFDVSADQAPDAIFASGGEHKNQAKGIVQILTQIIEDLGGEVAQGMLEEQNAQLEYEKLMAAAQKLHTDLNDKKTNLEVAISNLGDEKSNEEILKAANEEDLTDEKDYKASIKPDCDWIMKSFTKRASQRQAEMAGLTKAKEFLAGYTPALLEKGRTKPRSTFDDTALSKIRFLGVNH